MGAYRQLGSFSDVDHVFEEAMCGTYHAPKHEWKHSDEYLPDSGTVCKHCGRSASDIVDQLLRSVTS